MVFRPVRRDNTHQMERVRLTEKRERRKAAEKRFQRRFVVAAKRERRQALSAVHMAHMIHAVVTVRNRVPELQLAYARKQGFGVLRAHNKALLKDNADFRARNETLRARYEALSALG